MSNSLDFRIQNLKEHINGAKRDYLQGNDDNTLNNLRKACEAICRAVVLKKLPEADANKYISGQVTINLTVPGRAEIPLLSKLITDLTSKRWINDVIRHRLHDIRYGGNNASHDPVTVNTQVQPEDVTLCIAQFKNVLDWFYSTHMGTATPSGLKDFEVSLSSIPVQKSQWISFYRDCENFSKDYRYVLISSPEITGVTENQLAVLQRIHWSLIMDFNPVSKKSGLFKAISQANGSQLIRPISIAEAGKREPIINTSHHTLNYFFANGLDDLKDSVSTDIRHWRSTLKYSAFATRLIKEYIEERIQKTAYVYLYDKTDYIIDIIRAVDENISNPNLAKHIVVYQDSEMLPLLETALGSYNVYLHNIPISSIIAGIEKSVTPDLLNATTLTKQVPARIDGSETFTDISNKYVSFLNVGIEIVYQSISEEGDPSDENTFFKGETISWKELAVDADVRRHISEELINNCERLLQTNKGVYPIELRHRPGAGGTTLARRMAYNFSKKYPTIVINSFHKDKTSQAIFELSEVVQMPVLAIIEAYQVTKNDLNTLIRKVNADKKHLVILYTIRTFQESYVGMDKSKAHFLYETMFDIDERNRFYAKYRPLAINGDSEFKELGKKPPTQCEVIEFALAAYQKDFSASKLESYILNHLQHMPPGHLKFIGFASLIYNYTQMSTSDLWFASLFPGGSLNGDNSTKTSEEIYITKLFLNEKDDDLYPTNFWRPRFNLFAKELVELILGGTDTSNRANWKDNLATWSKDLIKSARDNHKTLTDDLRELFKNLFLNRENEDVLGTDENYEAASVANHKFSNIIKHVSVKEEQQSIFETLVDCYYDEYYYHGHLGRFIYEKAEAPADFERAYDEIDKAIDLGGEWDYNMWHIKGMCNRRKIEYLIRMDTTKYDDAQLDELEDLIQELTEAANADFTQSREINPFNLHSHTAEIQLLTQVITFGHRLKRNKKEKTQGLLEDYWYENQITEILNLLDEAQTVLNFSKDIDQSIAIIKSKNMILDCRAKFYLATGKFNQSSDRYRQLSESAPREMRPYFRRMFVYSTLAGKVDNQMAKYSQAWDKLSSHEFETIKRAIETNISEQPNNVFHIKLWLEAVRHSPKLISIDDCISVVNKWYENSANSKISNVEATYYLYVLYACKAISEDSQIDDSAVRNSKRYLDECRAKKLNDKFSFEWYGAGQGIKHLVNHGQLGTMRTATRFFTNTSLLQRVEGQITIIDDRQKGRIQLNCGLEAFFVPISGGFMKDADETKKVTFYVGFRQDQLIAWEVKRVDASAKKPEKEEQLRLEDIVIEDYDEKLDIVEAIPKITEPIAEDSPSLAKTNQTKLPGLKILGTIPPEELSRMKPKKK